MNNKRLRGVLIGYVNGSVIVKLNRYTYLATLKIKIVDGVFKRELLTKGDISAKVLGDLKTTRLECLDNKWYFMSHSLNFYFEISSEGGIIEAELLHGEKLKIAGQRIRKLKPNSRYVQYSNLHVGCGIAE